MLCTLKGEMRTAVTFVICLFLGQEEAFNSHMHSTIKSCTLYTEHWIQNK